MTTYTTSQAAYVIEYFNVALNISNAPSIAEARILARMFLLKRDDEIQGRVKERVLNKIYQNCRVLVGYWHPSEVSLSHPAERMTDSEAFNNLKRLAGFIRKTRANRGGRRGLVE